MPVQSDAPAVETKVEPAKVEMPVAEQPKPQLAKADTIVVEEPAVSPIRKRASRKAASRVKRPLSFVMKYGAAQQSAFGESRLCDLYDLAGDDLRCPSA